MVKLELNADERETLSRVLTFYRSELREEIADTDRKAFRDNLKKDEAFLNKILNTLNQEDSD